MPPSGAASANEPYVGKVVAAGQQGSKVPRGAVENPQREIVNAIKAAGIAPTNSDLNQLTRVIRGGQLDFDATDTGTADAISCQIILSHTQIVAGLPFTFIKGPNANATTTPTLTITDLSGNNGITGPIKKAGGGALAAADLPGGAIITVRADATGAFRIIDLLAASDVLSLIATKAPVGAITGNGWWRDPATGFTVEWGTNQLISASGFVNITFPRAFTTLFSVIASDNAAGSWSTSNASFNGVGAPTSTGFQAQGASWNGSAVTRNVNIAFGWHAFGLS